MGENLIANYEEVAAIILFAIGLIMLLIERNLLKKIIGMNIMDTALYLFLASMGFVQGRGAPIVEGGAALAEEYINPIPAGLVLTGIVVSVSVTALMLALTIKLYKRYRTLNLDVIYMKAQREKQ